MLHKEWNKRIIHASCPKESPSPPQQKTLITSLHMYVIDSSLSPLPLPPPLTLVDISLRSGVLLDSTGLFSKRWSGTQLSVSGSISGSSLPAGGKGKEIGRESGIGGGAGDETVCFAPSLLASELHVR